MTVNDTTKPFAPVTVPPLWDPHGHLREDTKEGQVVGPLIQASYDGGACLIGAMPNTQKGLLTADDVQSYLEHCQTVGPGSDTIRILPYVQITPQTTKAIIDACVKGDITDAKVYPLNRTTKSQNGVEYYHGLFDIIAYACQAGMNVHFHPEYPMPEVENRDAEYLFTAIIDMVMDATKGMAGSIIWEHGTDARCVPFWRKWAKTGRFFVTLTAHHLVFSENEAYGDVHATIKPPYKTRQDRTSLVDLVMEGNAWVMAGTDSAGHDKSKKYVLGQCACGAFTAPFAMALYAHALRRLLTTKDGQVIFIMFTSGNAQALYGGTDDRQVVISDESFQIPTEYQIGTWKIVPFMAGQEISCSTKWM